MSPFKVQLVDLTDEERLEKAIVAVKEALGMGEYFIVVIALKGTEVTMLRFKRCSTMFEFTALGKLGALAMEDTVSGGE